MNNSEPLSETLDHGRRALAEALRAGFRMLVLTMTVIVAAYLLSGFFIVQEHQRAYVLVLGRITGVGAERIKEPGLHWTWPKPIGEIVRVPTGRMQALDVDTFWREEQDDHPGDHLPQPPDHGLQPDRDGYMLTGDANIVHARWRVRYTIRDPETYLFKVADAGTVLNRETERAAALTSRQWVVDRTLRTDTEAFRETVERELRQRLHEYPIGLDVHRLDLLDMEPPRRVAPAFDKVTESEEDRSRAVSAARTYAARAVNEAEGTEARIRSEAMAERQSRVSRARADAGYFTSVLAAFRSDPGIISHTIWQDRMRTILLNVNAQYVIHEREDGTRELRLQLGPDKDR